MVQFREGGGEPVEEVAGAGEEVGLEDPDEPPAGEGGPSSGNGVVDFAGVVGVIVDDGEARRVVSDVESPGDAGEGGKPLGDGAGVDARPEGEGRGGGGVCRIVGAGHGPGNVDGGVTDQVQGEGGASCDICRR